MARIRSIHPSLFTDEKWVSCSASARLLYIGLLTEADDFGLFEWKPLQIKMRLCPGDNLDIPPLLAELVAADLVAPLTSDGKSLGAIRYFCRFQRPRRPTALYVLPPEWSDYVGINADAGDVEDDRFPTMSGITPQKEEGGRRKGMEDVTPPQPRAPATDWPDGDIDGWIAKLAAVGGGKLDPAKNPRLVETRSLVAQWKLNGFSFSLDVLPTVQRLCAQKRSPVGSWEYFNRAVRESFARRMGFAGPVSAADIQPQGPRHDDRLTRNNANMERALNGARAALERQSDGGGRGFGGD